MRKALIFGLIALAILLTSSAYAEEITLTTYYPAPYGVYREMRAQRMAIGDGYYDSSAYCWQGNCTNAIDSNADLVVEGNVGIGTQEPGATLEVNGNIKLQSGVAINNISTSQTLGGGSASDLAIPTQKAVKAYVDAAGGGGCYMSYTGACASGFNVVTGSGASFGWCGVKISNTRYYFYRPPGGSCPSGWGAETTGTAVVCCQ